MSYVPYKRVPGCSTCRHWRRMRRGTQRGYCPKVNELTWPDDSCDNHDRRKGVDWLTVALCAIVVFYVAALWLQHWIHHG